MNYLITGITGFVGPHLAKLLIKHNHKVYGFYRSHKKKMALKRVLNDYEFNKITFIDTNLEYVKGVYDVFQKHSFDGVFNLAAVTHIPTSIKEPFETLKINTNGVLTIYNAIQKFQGHCRLLQCSTGDVYGTYPTSVLMDETYPLHPSNPYAISKALVDLYLQEQKDINKVQTIIVRPFSHTGPFRPANFSISSDAFQIAEIIHKRQAPVINVGNLLAKRTFLDVRDIVEIYYQLMINYTIPSGEIFNISGNELYEIGDHLKTMLSLYNLKDIELRPNVYLYRASDIHKQLQRPDNSKICKLLNWKPHYTREQTLFDLVEYWIKYAYMEKL